MNEQRNERPCRGETEFAALHFQTRRSSCVTGHVDAWMVNSDFLALFGLLDTRGIPMLTVQ